MEHYPLPKTLRNGWIGPMRERFAGNKRDIAERLRVALIQDLVNAGCYLVDPAHIARGVLAAAVPARRH